MNLNLYRREQFEHPPTHTSTPHTHLLPTTHTHGIKSNYISIHYILLPLLITAFIYRDTAGVLGTEEGRYWGLIAPDDGA